MRTDEQEESTSKYFPIQDRSSLHLQGWHYYDPSVSSSEKGRDGPRTLGLSVGCRYPASYKLARAKISSQMGGVDFIHPSWSSTS